VVTGTRGQANLPACVMTFAYWNPDLLGQSRLLNVQTGEYMDVQVRVLGEEEELGFRRVRVGQCGLEPFVGVAAVVGRQVSHQPHAARMGSGGQARHRRVAAEQRIDLAEGGRVVAVVGVGREERRQVDRADAQRGDVVEVCDDAIEVAAPVLAQAEGLDIETLIECARTKNQEHLLAISRRKALPDKLTDVLVERGDQQVVLSTAKSSGSRFSDGGFNTLIKRALRHPGHTRYSGAIRRL